MLDAIKIAGSFGLGLRKRAIFVGACATSLQYKISTSGKLSVPLLVQKMMFAEGVEVGGAASCLLLAVVRVAHGRPRNVPHLTVPNLVVDHEAPRHDLL